MLMGTSGLPILRFSQNNVGISYDCTTHLISPQ